MTNVNRSLRQVHPSLRQRRPLVNGEPVAFHMRDFMNSNSGMNTASNNNGNQSNSLHHDTCNSDSDSSSSSSSSQSSTSSNNGTENKRKYESDLIVVLDMDECLIHSKFLSSPAAAQVYAHQLRRQHNTANAATTDSKDGSGSGSAAASKLVDSFRVHLPDGDLVHVNVRPGLTDFLDRVTQKYETHIFTAAMKVYAKPVLDQLESNSNSKFAGRWYRESCQLCPVQGAYIKNLHNLQGVVDPAYMDRVVLVDNNPLSFLAQPSNGILVSNFYNDPTDTTLPAVWQLLEELDQCQDVRPVLEERFRLKEALADIHSAAKVAQ